uniref:Uncharacterized protein n=1 Tax=Aegilops tauschii subsp. strangulata TaxID=200361 RepID=A0A453GXZ1_AEGTS
LLEASTPCPPPRSAPGRRSGRRCSAPPRTKNPRFPQNEGNSPLRRRLVLAVCFRSSSGLGSTDAPAPDVFCCAERILQKKTSFRQLHRIPQPCVKPALSGAPRPLGGFACALARVRVWVQIIPANSAVSPVARKVLSVPCLHLLIGPSFCRYDVLYLSIQLVLRSVTCCPLRATGVFQLCAFTVSSVLKTVTVNF